MNIFPLWLGREETEDPWIGAHNKMILVLRLVYYYVADSIQPEFVIQVSLKEQQPQPTNVVQHIQLTDRHINSTSLNVPF